MLGVFQSDTLRIELEASTDEIHRYLVEPEQLRQWLWPQELDPRLSESLQVGTEFHSQLGSIRFNHRVQILQPGQMQLLLWGGADGFCQWNWGNGWVQLRLEAISLLPLSLGQVVLLQRLQAHARSHSQGQGTSWHWNMSL